MLSATTKLGAVLLLLLSGYPSCTAWIPASPAARGHAVARTAPLFASTEQRMSMSTEPTATSSTRTGSRQGRGKFGNDKGARLARERFESSSPPDGRAPPRRRRNDNNNNHNNEYSSFGTGRKGRQQRRNASDLSWQQTLANTTNSMRDQMVLLREQTETAIAGQFLPTSAERASQVVRAMHEADRVAPVVSYNAVLKAWKSYATLVRRSRVDWERAVVECEALLAEMAARKAADVVSYTTLIAVLALRDFEIDSATRAESVFRQMQHYSIATGDNNVAPNARTRNAVLRAWTNADDLEHAVALLAEWEADPESNLQLTTASYATLMAGFARSRNQSPDDSLRAVVQLWNRLWDRYEKDGLKICRPNLFALTIFIGVCNQHRSVVSAKLATKALGRYYKLQRTVPVEPEAMTDDEDLNIDHVDSMAASNSANKDEILPLEAKRAAHTHLHKVHTQVLTQVLDCWQKCGDRESGEQAETVLRWMVREYKATGDKSLRPNAFSFSTAIGAWARSRRFGKAKAAQNLLKWMQELYDEGVVGEPPNVYCYTAVINSAAYSEKDDSEAMEALRIAVDALRELQSNRVADSPSHITYAAFLTALRNLSPPTVKRTAAARQVFRQAVADGQVCPLVLQRLESTVTSHYELQDILEAAEGIDFDSVEDKKVSPEQIPAYWRRNVKKPYQPIR